MKTLNKAVDLSTNETKLTEGESSFLYEFLRNNDCGASNAEELLEDNFSCQCIEDLNDTVGKDLDLNANQIGGFLSSLQEKGIIWVDERDGAICKSKNYAKRLNFEPDLYWVSDDYLTELSNDITF